MALQTILLAPGVNAEATDTLNVATISQSQLVRFKLSGTFVLVEKMGGWQKYYPAPVNSPVRELHAWVDLAATTHLAIAAEQSLTVLTNGTANDITPATLVSNVAVNFSTTNASNVITVVDANIITTALDSIYIQTPISIGGLLLQGSYQISLTLSSTSYQFKAASNATSTVSNGGVVPVFSTTNNSSSVNVQMTGHGLSVGNSFSVPTPTTVGGLTVSGYYVVQSVVDANNFTINNTYVATSTASGSMNGGNAEITYYITIAPIANPGGYGVGPYGLGGYGIGVTPSPTAGNPMVTTNYTLDNWGEIIMACPTGGAIYRWSADAGFNNATRILTAPIANGGIFISNPYQILIAWGSSIGSVQDPLLIAWSDSGNFNTWTATALNQAGTYRIPTGSKIMGALQGPQFGFIWTDIDVWAMTYVQPPFVFGFNKLAAECGLIARHAACVTNSTVYWMGNNQFYQYAGQGVQPIVCSVWDVIFQDLDLNNLDKIYAGTNNGFGEIMWFFPSLSGGTGEVDSYVKYNFVLQCWDYGRLARTAWIDQSVLGQPIGGDPNGFVFQHEVANDADGQAMGEFFETGFARISDGDQMMFVDWMLPDFTHGMFNGPQNATLQITFKYLDYPNQQEKIKGPYQVNATVLYRNPRLRGRQIAMRIEGTGLGGWWRMGGLRYRSAPDGKR